MSSTIVALGEVVEIKGGGTPSKKNPHFYIGDIPWVTPKDMKVWEITDSIDHINEEAVSQSTTNLVPENSVLLVNRSGILKHTLPVAISKRPVAINQDMKALLCSDRLDPHYLAYLLKAAEPTVLRWVRATTADNFPIQLLRELKIPLPPLEEQKRIARILDQAASLCRLRTRALDKLNILGQAIFHEMFGDWRRGTIWPMVPLGSDLVFLTSGSRGWAKFYSQSGAKFIRIQNVRSDFFDRVDLAHVKPPQTAEAKRTKVEPGDVLLSITADIGRSAVVPEGLGDAHINQHLAILRPKDFNPRFLSAAIASAAGQATIQKKNREGVKAGLNFDDIRSFEFPLPSIEMQKKFVTRIQEIETRMTLLRRSELEMSRLFASLQHRAFRGEL